MSKPVSGGDFSEEEFRLLYGPSETKGGGVAPQRPTTPTPESKDPSRRLVQIWKEVKAAYLSNKPENEKNRKVEDLSNVLEDVYEAKYTPHLWRELLKVTRYLREMGAPGNAKEKSFLLHLFLERQSFDAYLAQLCTEACGGEWVEASRLYHKVLDLFKKEARARSESLGDQAIQKVQLEEEKLFNEICKKAADFAKTPFANKVQETVGDAYVLLGVMSLRLFAPKPPDHPFEHWLSQYGAKEEEAETFKAYLSALEAIKSTGKLMPQMEAEFKNAGKHFNKYNVVGLVLLGREVLRLSQKLEGLKEPLRKIGLELIDEAMPLLETLKNSFRRGSIQQVTAKIPSSTTALHAHIFVTYGHSLVELENEDLDLEDLKGLTCEILGLCNDIEAG